MTGILYHHLFSPPSRSVLLTIRNLGLNTVVKNVDIYKGEQHSPEYLKINPLNQIPAYVEGDFILTESKAILTYLANANKSKLYPEDCRKRALVDSKLYFDTNVVFPSVRNFVRPVLRNGVKKIDQQVREDIKLSLSRLNMFLQQTKWIAGEELSVADLAVLANLGTLKCLGENFDTYPKVQSWFKNCENLPGFGENIDSAQKLANRVAELLDEPLRVTP